jgi:hypothetical protein
MLMKAQIPTADGNRAIQDGSLPELIRKTLESVQAESAYFTTMDGQRTMIVVFDLKAAADIPKIAEPLFMAANASVEFMPCMNAEDLKAGLSAIK